MITRTVPADLQLFMILRLISLRRIITPLFLLCLTVVFPASAQPTCPTRRIVPERLPDLNIPRSGHSIFYANGELTVVGGHTIGFVPTPTAEYFDNGAWHPMPMVYSHDNGFAVTLRSDEFLIGGGHDEELGIGQTFTLERYNSTTHSFEGFGCLDRRRVLANATQLKDGRIIISGNHYASDGIGCFDGSSQVQDTKSVYQGRSNPYIFPISSDDAIIFGGNDIYDKHPDTIWVDRIKGEPFYVPMLSRWRPLYSDQPFSSEACGIGEYTYLLTVTDSVGQLGFVEVSDTTFTLLPTTCPVPMRCKFGPIFYKGPIAIDRERSRGYVIGVDSLCRRQYVLSVDFSRTPASLTLYYTDILEHSSITIPVVTPEGDLLLVGGISNDNYKPLASVWLYHFVTDSPAVASMPSATLLIFLILLVLALVAMLTYIILRKHHRPTPSTLPDDEQPRQPYDTLMDQIVRLMDEEQLYLRSDLKVQDVAVSLGTNSHYVSECINSVRGQTFTQFVNVCRIRHAQELLRKTDAKISSVSIQSGFSTESSFFRNFKSVTGMTPREWLAKQ